MIRAIRSQNQTPEEARAFSLAAGKVIPDDPSEDLTRQEFREESDLNYLLGQYGVQAPQHSRVPQFGETDWDLDLHSAHIALDRAQLAFRHLSPDLREKFQSPSGMLDAMNSGELEKALRAEIEARANADPPVPTPSEPSE